MSGLGVLAALWILGAPLLAIILAVRAGNRARRTGEHLETLQRRLALLDEARLAERTREVAGLPPAASTEPSAPVEAPAPTAEAVRRESAVAGPLPTTPAATPEFATPPAPAERPRESFESKIGARWSVLVGGLALALGAVFLVRYSIEQNLLTERMRIALGFALAGVLFLAGEVLRRRDRADKVPVFGKADVPAILTAAAGVATFATVYAAYALYGFIDGAAAFVLLTAAGLLTLVLSVIHGPSLAALGAVGSYVAPLLVSSAAPQPLPLVLHTLAVTGAVLGIARIRGWAWLAIAGMAGALIWGLLAGLLVSPDPTEAELVLTAGLALLVMGILLTGRSEDYRRDHDQDPITLAALAGVAALSLYFAWVTPNYPALLSGIALAGAIGAGASRWPSVAAAALIAGALAVLTVMLIGPAPDFALPTMRIGEIQWHVLGDEGLAAFAMNAAAIGLMVGLGGFLTADRIGALAPRSAGFFAAASAGAPFLILLIVYMRHVPFETRPAFGVAALAMAAIFAVMTERLIAQRPSDIAAPAPAFYAAGAVLALSFAIAVGLTTDLIPLAFALGAAGVAVVAAYRPVRILPWLSAFLSVLACLALFRHGPLTVEEIGTRPFFNGLILRFGLPALAILLTGEILRRQRGCKKPAGIVQALGLAVAGLFVTLEIRHFAGDGVISGDNPGLGEQSALTLAAFAFALVLQEIARRADSKVYRAASLVSGALAAIHILVGHFITANPLLTGESVGAHPVLNLLLPGYLLPALAAAWLAASGRRSRPLGYSITIAALAVALGLAYVTLMVRHGFHGEVLAGGGIADAENWTYSAIWLAFGIALLAVGIRLRTVTVRAASGIVIAAVICKVFLVDMAALTGALRAASFLGLGVILIVIGRIYQRLLLTSREAPKPVAA